MDANHWLAEQFDGNRSYLRGVAYRMLGSTSEAEDAVQEAWIRLARSESEHIENIRGWLTTVVSRICLDMLRTRQSRREESLSENDSEIPDEGQDNPESDFLLADSVGQALLIVLDTLSPAERIAFVLHDLFDLPFEEIAPIIDRTGAATRQLASRARRRIRGVSPSRKDRQRQREIVTAFLAASRDGDFDALIQLLHPDVVLRADEIAVKAAQASQSRGAPQLRREISGARDVANTFKGRAAEARLALLNGKVGATWAPKGKPVVAFCFSMEEGRIAAIDIVMDAARLRDIDIAIIDHA